MALTSAEKSRRWRDRHPGRSRVSKRRTRIRSYGISPEQYDAMHDAQGGACAICGESETASARNGTSFPLGVDHDHVTDNVRGLLCSWCNPGLGKFKDDPALLRAAADYLEKHASMTADPTQLPLIT